MTVFSTCEDNNNISDTTTEHSYHEFVNKIQEYFKYILLHDPSSEAREKWQDSYLDNKLVEDHRISWRILCFWGIESHWVRRCCASGVSYFFFLRGRGECGTPPPPSPKKVFRKPWPVSWQREMSRKTFTTDMIHSLLWCLCWSSQHMAWHKHVAITCLSHHY